MKNEARSCSNALALLGSWLNRSTHPSKPTLEKFKTWSHCSVPEQYFSLAEENFPRSLSQCGMRLSRPSTGDPDRAENMPFTMSLSKDKRGQNRMGLRDTFFGVLIEPGCFHLLAMPASLSVGRISR